MRNDFLLDKIKSIKYYLYTVKKKINFDPFIYSNKLKINFFCVQVN